MAKRELTPLEKYEKETSKLKDTRATSICYVFFLLFTFIPLKDSIVGLVAIFAFIAVCISAGLLAHKKYKNHQQIISLYKQSVSILNSHPDGDLDTLAKHTGQSVSQCIANLETMIDNNLFTNAFVDRGANRLVVNRKNELDVEGNDPSDYVPCKCPGCGGYNRVKKGQNVPCDYCGNILRTSKDAASGGMIEEWANRRMEKQVKQTRAMLYTKEPALYNKFKRYVAIMNTYPEGNLTQLARNTGASKEETIGNLEKIIGNGWFRNAYIDRDMDRLVIVKDQIFGEAAQNQPRMTVVCSACGGINSVPAGTTAECDFCGSPVNSNG